MLDREPMLMQPRAYLFMVVIGPTYTPDEFEPLLRLLSQRFEGELWSYGSYEADMEFGRMRLRVVKCRSRLRLLHHLRFARHVMMRAHQLRRATPAQMVVTSYDPFKGGLLALRVARVLRSRFICEVNGVYGDPNDFAHINSAVSRRIRLITMRRLASFVLRRATAVRLLFAEQLDAFVKPPAGTVVRHFFALSYLDRFYPGTAENIVLSAGFPFELKGIDVLVAAFTRLAPQFPGWRLVLIGHLVPEQLRLRRLEHPQIVALAGMPQRELADWMSRCAIFVLASRCEAMGRVLLEAASAEKCRVATRVGGIPTVIEHGRDGLLVTKESVEELVSALEQLMNNSFLREKLAIAGKQRVRQEFSAEVYLQHFEELIDATLRAEGRPAAHTA